MLSECQNLFSDTYAAFVTHLEFLWTLDLGATGNSCPEKPTRALHQYAENDKNHLPVRSITPCSIPSRRGECEKICGLMLCNSARMKLF